MKITKKDIIELIVILITTTIVLGNWIKMHYATDTYTIIERGYENYAINNSLKDGRIFMSGIILLVSYFNYDIILLVRATLISSIVISCVGVIFLKKVILQYKEEKNVVNELVSCIISYVIIFNFMYLDNLYFVECFVMSISILLYLMAAHILVEHKKGYLYKSMLLVILGVFSYQGTINFFITMTFVLSLVKYDKLTKKVIKNLLTCGIICVIAVVLNLLQIKIVETIFSIEQTRIRGFDCVIQNIQYIFIKMPEIMINTSNLFPNYGFIGFIAILLLFSYLYYMVKSQKEIYQTGNMVLIGLVAYFSCFAIHLFSLSSFGSGRMMFSIGAMIGILFMYIFLKIPILEHKKMRNVFLLLLLAYFLIHMWNYLQKVYLEIETNHQDKQMVEKIENIIKEYESNTKKYIEKIAFCMDMNCEKARQNKFNPPMGNSAIYPTWSRVGLINYWTDRNLKEVKMEEEIYHQYFKDKDWKEFDEAQCILVEDTLYYCIY